jgi:threonine aldolase
VGDDVYKQEPNGYRIRSKVAAMFGMEAGLFFRRERWRTNNHKTAYAMGEQLIADKYTFIIMKEAVPLLIVAFLVVYLMGIEE